ncbi:tetratricopeptide repeat protein [Salmonella enterica subsp. enterica]|uniref:Tetratricopeptide repeat protein n=1 Tax=Salmonella enterica I TaxID=59201 RepID=A0A3S4IJM7_SALET|nr:tetratricopeptide repeat protein [Salmonella enterica subsp. enterica]
MFANDERNGLKREFNDRTGKVLSALPYVDGDKEGTEEAYDEGRHKIHPLLPQR